MRIIGSDELMALAVGEVRLWFVDKQVGVADIEVQPITRRIFRAERNPVPIVIRNTRGPKLGTLDRRLVVSAAHAQSQVFAGVPFEADRITHCVIVIDVQDVGRRAGVVEYDRHGLESAPMRPGHIAHHRELMEEALVNAGVHNVRQIQVRSHALIEEDRLERAGRRKRRQWRRACSGNQRNPAKLRVAFERMINLRAVTDTDAPILEATLFAFARLAIFEESANGKTKRPIVARNFGHAIAAAGKKSSRGVSRPRCGDRARDRCRWNTARSEDGRQCRVKLRERSLRGEAEVDRLGQAR